MVGLAAVALTGLDGLTAEVQETRKPNVVFFLVDDLGWADLGYSGSTFYETPNIDRLAASGMVFEQGYAACPVCSPTRSSIMTGKYPARTQNTDWFGAPQPGENYSRNTRLQPARYVPRMVLEEETLAEAFRDGGYRTAFLGKWHLGGEGFFPEDQGFEINIGGTRVGNPGRGGYEAPFNVPVPWDEEGEHLTDRLALEASKIIENWRDEPFLVYLSFYNVHTPLEDRAEFIEYFRAKRKRLGIEESFFGDEPPRQVRLNQNHAIYASMVKSTDNAVGTVLKTVADLGLADDTIVVFFSDNGGLCTSEGSPTSNLPLRAGKGWMYEGGIREPLIVRVPGVTREGSRTEVPVISTDFYPTLLEASGLPLNEDQHRDGRSFWPLLNGKAFSQRAVFWHYPHYGNQGGAPASAIREGDYKLIDWYEPGRDVELFNLREDISEKRNLAPRMPGLRDEMLRKLNRWRKSVGALEPTPNPNFDQKSPAH